MRRLFAVLAALAIAGPLIAARPVTLKGSGTMVIMNAKLAEKFMAKNPGTAIQVTGGGSGVGLAALINGTTEVAASSRPIKTSEIDKLKTRFATRGIGILMTPIPLFDVTADGQRFLINQRAEDKESVPVTLLINWTAALKNQR